MPIFNFPIPYLQFGVYTMGKGGVEMTQNISDITAILTPVFNHYGISRAILFGSIAKGTATDKVILICWWTATSVD